MKRSAKRILSFLLAACMMLGMLPALVLTIGADTATGAVAYDDAKDGDLLYTVNFKFNDVYSKHVKDTTATSTISTDGRKLTFSNKETAAPTYYGGFLKGYRIVGNVYTISYYTETTSLGTRLGVQIFNETKRIGVVSVANNTKAMNILANGSTGEAVPNEVQRKNDAENGNRQYFKVVVDGVNMVARFYALDVNNTYSLLVEVALDYTASHNYLAIGMYNFDALTGNNTVSVGDVEIRKGDEFASSEKTSYQTRYDVAKDGDVLFDVDFSDENDAGYNWGGFRLTSNMVENAVSDSGKTLTFSYDKTATQIYSAYLPEKEAIRYGSYTYEFFVKSEKRVGMSVLGTTGSYALGFSYFNSTAKNLFMTGAGWADTSNTTITGNIDRSVATAYQEVQAPNTKDETKPNVKIEVDTFACTITNYILNDEGKFIKTAMISYGGSSFYPIVYPYAYDLSTNAVFKNVKVVKGLSVSGTGVAAVDVRIDGVYQSTVPQVSTALGKLPALVEKEHYTVAYQLADGSVVKSLDELTYTAGYNLVDLTTVYTPVAISEGKVELRAIQSLTNPTGDTTTVRFVGIVNELDLEAVGFELWVIYKDADGNTYVGNSPVIRSTQVVYSSVLENGNTPVTAEELGGKYVYAISVSGVPVGEGVQVDFLVTPYSIAEGLTDVEENRVKGEMITVSFVNGVYAPNAAPIE